MEHITNIFIEQQQHKLTLRTSSADERIAKLKKLKSTFSKYRNHIISALKTDLNRPETESELVEVVATIAEINFAIKNVRKWMQPVDVAADITTMLGRSEIRYEPKGSSLIISPWNYPVYLSIVPIASAIAAGNTVILKPSELAPASAQVLEDIISEAFPKEEITVIQGAVETSQALLDLPFDHIFFTGSTAVGKIVMEKAAKHLSSVTLELGGKSPVLVHKSANIKLAAQKIAWGKCINAGQTCIAPDYLLVDEAIKAPFMEALKAEFNHYRTLAKTGEYSKIISQKHYNRLLSLQSGVVEQSKSVLIGEAFRDQHMLLPSIIEEPADDAAVMQEEIFGPILPVKFYHNMKDAVRYVNQGSKPLALYIFSGNSTFTNEVIAKTSSGGVCVNDVILHISNPHLPFGGINGSGLGSYHGYYGFKAFSHERAIFRQNRFLSITKWIAPPYAGKKWLIKWLERLV